MELLSGSRGTSLNSCRDFSGEGFFLLHQGNGDDSERSVSPWESLSEKRGRSRTPPAGFVVLDQVQTIFWLFLQKNLWWWFSFLVVHCSTFTHCHAHAGSQWAGLLHAVPQHLIGCDEHDADDEGHGESADEALPHAGLTVLLRGVNWN